MGRSQPGARPTVALPWGESPGREDGARQTLGPETHVQTRTH